MLFCPSWHFLPPSIFNLFLEILFKLWCQTFSSLFSRSFFNIRDYQLLYNLLISFFLDPTIFLLVFWCLFYALPEPFQIAIHKSVLDTTYHRTISSQSLRFSTAGFHLIHSHFVHWCGATGHLTKKIIRPTWSITKSTCLLHVKI